MSTYINTTMIKIQSINLKFNMKTMNACYISKGTFQMPILKKNTWRINTFSWKHISPKSLKFLCHSFTSPSYSLREKSSLPNLIKCGEFQFTMSNYICKFVNFMSLYNILIFKSKLWVRSLFMARCTRYNILW